MPYVEPLVPHTQNQIKRIHITLPLDQNAHDHNTALVDLF